MNDFYLLSHDSLVTAEIVYHMPDYPSMLQTFIWQEVDTPPEFLRLKRFLNFWEENLDGKIHIVRVSAFDEYYNAEMHHYPHGFAIH